MATYYVDATGGDDINAGTSEGLAWQTLEKVNQTTFTAGDSILFKRGETWRGMIDVDDSGTTAARITYGAYGTGDKPKLKGSILADEAFIVPVSGDLESDDFEDGSIDAFWTSTTGTHVVDTYTNFGIAGPTGGGDDGLQMDDNANSALVYESTTPYTNLWVEFDSRSPSAFAGDESYFFAIYDEDGTQTHSLRWYTGGLFRWFKGGVGGANSTNAAFSVDTWYKVKIQMITDPTNTSGRGLTRVWVDDVLVLTVDKTTTFGGLSDNKKIGGFSIGNDGNPSGSFQYFDNVRYSRSNFDIGVGLWTQGVYPFLHDTDDNQLKMWVDGEALRGPETTIGAVDAAGEFIMGDGSPIANTDFNYYWFSDYSGQTVELPFEYWNGSGSGNYYPNILHIVDKECITLDNLNISQSRASCISLDGAASPMRCNTVQSCDISEAIYAGIEITHDVRDALISSNNITGCEHSGLYTNSDDLNYATNITIENNFFNNNALEGIYLERINTATIANNIIVNTVADALGTWGRALMVGWGTGVDKVVGRISIYNNTIAGSVDDTLMLHDAGDGDAIIDFCNNIVVQNNTGKLTATSLLSESSEVLQMDYNCFWHSLSDTETVWEFSDADYNRTELADYQTNTGHGEHSLFADPQLDANYAPHNPLVTTGGKPDANGDPTSMGAIGASASTAPQGLFPGQTLLP